MSKAKKIGESKMFDRSVLEKLFDIINYKLQDRNIVGEIHLYGGAAMLLLFTDRLSTKDIDAIFAPKNIFHDIIKEIEEEQQMQKDWLNDAVKGFFSAKSQHKPYKELSNLRIYVAEPEYLLAMKLISSRLDTPDVSDIKTLINSLEIKKKSALHKILNKYYYKSPLVSTKVGYVIDDIASVLGLSD
jgi:hypothetical protein